MNGFDKIEYVSKVWCKLNKCVVHVYLCEDIYEWGIKVKENVFLKHGSQWNAGTMPSIACWNSFFLFSLKGLALFSLRRDTKQKQKIHRLLDFGLDFVSPSSAPIKQNTPPT